MSGLGRRVPSVLLITQKHFNLFSDLEYMQWFSNNNIEMNEFGRLALLSITPRC